MTGCIYHEADLDGVMSAAIVKKYFKGDIDLLPYNYGKEIPDVNKYDKVFVVDVSFGNRTRFLFYEWKDKGTDVIWIDHHKTAIDDMRDYEVKGKRRIGTATCELTWEYLFDDIKTPNVVELLSAYDVWDHDRFEWSDVLSFQYGMRVKSCYFEFFYTLYAHAEQKAETSDRKNHAKNLDRTKAILSYIDRNYKEAISIADIASYCGFSESHFMRFFKNTMGVSFTTYLCDFRLNIAARLLVTTDDSILSIAESCGFFNLSYFNRSFKKKYGITPGAYRKR